MTKPYFFQMAVKEVTQADDGSVRIRGYASTPQLDRYRDIVEPSAFEGALKQYMENPVLLRSHDGDRPVGLVEKATVTEKGLWIEAIVKESVTAKEVADGLFRTFSIGYIATKTEIRNGDNEPLGEGDSMWDASNIRVIKALDLVEISIVSTPANPGALFTLAKSLKAFTNRLAFKAFGGDEQDNIPANETGGTIEGDASDEEAETEEVTPPAAEEVAEVSEEKDAEEVVETPAAEEPAPVETPAPEATADEVTEPTDETKEVATEATEEAENGAEIAPADGAEGGDKPTEEAKADAEPVAEGETTEEESKEIVVTKDVADLLPDLKTVGAIREMQDGEKPEVMSKSTVALLKKLHDALASENERANTELKRANDLQAKLDATPEKKTLATHRQFASEEDVESNPQAKGVSDYFASLFNLNK